MVSFFFGVLFFTTFVTSIQVKTDKGPIEGLLNAGLSSFLGVPYARPPVGEFRWQAPQPHDAWTSVLATTNYSASCLQTMISGYTFPDDITFSEDCLYLNVWTPNVTGLKAVMVWIHGGGLVHGGNSEYRLRGDYMSNSGDVVVVNINYRLGVIGWLAHAAFSQDDPNRLGTGNYGLLDQQMALKWVQNNIINFGGDPTRVTIMGESAGGSSVCLHMVSPLSKGLFAQAIIESGACFDETHLLAEAVQTANKFQEKANCGGSPEEIIKCLRLISTTQILNLQGQTNFQPWAIVNGAELLEHPYLSLVNKRINPIKGLLAGNVLNEGSTFISQRPMSQEAYNNYLYGTFSSFAPLVMDMYPCSLFNSSDCWYAATTLIGDFLLICPTMFAIDVLSSSVPTYAYVFTHIPLWGNTSLPGMGAFHSSEIAFVFSTLASIYPYTTDEVTLANQMTSWWTNFATWTDPNRKEENTFPVWSPYGTTETREVLQTEGGGVVQGYKSKECTFWNTVYSVKYNL